MYVPLWYQQCWRMLKIPYSCYSEFTNLRNINKAEFDSCITITTAAFPLVIFSAWGRGVTQVCLAWRIKIIFFWLRLIPLDHYSDTTLNCTAWSIVFIGKTRKLFARHLHDPGPITPQRAFCPNSIIVRWMQADPGSTLKLFYNT